MHPTHGEASSSGQPVRALALTFATFALGLSVQVADGHRRPAAMGWLTVGLVCLLVAMISPAAPARASRVLARAVPWVAAALLGAQLIVMLERPVGAYLHVPGNQPPLFWAVALAAVGAAGVLLVPGRRAWMIAGAIALGSFLLAGTWLIHASPDPAIDVHAIASRGLPALLRGQNPYAIAYPNIYADPSPFYGAEWVSGDNVRFGYAYMPVTLLLELPGLILGDYRFAHLAAMVAGAALIAWARPGRSALLLSLLALYTPRGLFVLEQGWVEPVVVLTVAATVFIAVRRPSWLPWAFGVMLVSKQFMVVALPLWRHLQPRGPWARQARPLLQAAALGAALTIPMIVWDPAAFWRSAVELQLALKFRPDSMSYPALLRHLGWDVSTLWAFPALVAMLAWGALRGDRTPAGFLTTLAASFCVFFAFNKQAFCNYYYLVLVLSAWGAALSVPAPEAEPG